MVCMYAKGTPHTLSVHAGNMHIIPVLPEVGSMTVPPGRSFPNLSASSIILIPIRSFMEPPGFMNSHFATASMKELLTIDAHTAKWPPAYIQYFPLSQHNISLLFTLTEVTFQALCLGNLVQFYQGSVSICLQNVSQHGIMNVRNSVNTGIHEREREKEGGREGERGEG